MLSTKRDVTNITMQIKISGQRLAYKQPVCLYTAAEPHESV